MAGKKFCLLCLPVFLFNIRSVPMHVAISQQLLLLTHLMVLLAAKDLQAFGLIRGDSFPAWGFVWSGSN